VNRDWFNQIVRSLGGKDFDGLEPADVFDLMFHLHDPRKSPMVLNPSVDEELIKGVPFYRKSVLFLEAIAEHEPVKLTATGNLPLTMCRMLVAGGVDRNREGPPDDYPIHSELDRSYLHAINTITNLAGLTRKQHGKMTVTKKCRSDLRKGAAIAIYTRLLRTYMIRFSWAYEDCRPGEPLIQSLAGYSIYLVHKYGAESRPTRFYANKFLQAFPHAKRAFAAKQGSLPEEEFWRCYSLRTFERFLCRFGLVEIQRDHEWRPTTETLKRTGLFDDLVKWRRGAAAGGSRVPVARRKWKGLDNVLQFKITLRHARPPIWRRIQVPANYTFWDLHVAIQDAMGWSDSHLHEFVIHSPETGIDARVGIPDDEFSLGPRVLAGWRHRIADWFTPENHAADYAYDFGDGWEHEVRFEGALPRDKATEYPVCLDGARACPPEDVGGVDGYAEFLRAISDPAHDEHDEMLQWVGGEFDPEHFSPEEVSFDDPEDRKQVMLFDF